MDLMCRQIASTKPLKAAKTTGGVIMALIQTIPPEKAEGKLAELYTEVEQLFGRVPNNVQMLGISPTILETQLELVGYYREHPALRTPLLAMIRMLVSKACKSPYCQKLKLACCCKRGSPGNR